MNIQAASTPSRIGTQQLCATQLQSLDTHLAEDLPVQASSPQLSSPLLDDLDSFGQLEEATTAYKRSSSLASMLLAHDVSGSAGLIH